MRNTIRMERMSWLVQIILLVVIISLFVILIRILRNEYIKQLDEQNISLLRSEVTI